MNYRTDGQLLRIYAEHSTESAFAELVRRHLDFVHSAALRMVCDPHLAEDVTQSVFVALAKNAARLTERTNLCGWLHQTAQNIAAQTVRTIERRRAREQAAATMNQLLSSESNISWEQIAPHLETALGELDEPDRDALFFRYFKNYDLRTVGTTLGISDDAAQKRVSRSLDRLRCLLAKRGVTIGTGGLAIVISANAVQAAPVGLGVTIAAAIAGAAVSTSTIITATKTIAMTTLQKTIIAAAFVAAVGAGIFEACQIAQLRDQNQMFQQQQAHLAEQIQQLQQEGYDATNRFNLTEQELVRAKANQSELLKLRGEIGSLRRQKADENMQKSQVSESLKSRTPALALPVVRQFDNNQVVSDSKSDEYARRLSDLAWLSNSFAGDARNFQYALHRYAEDHNGQLPQQFPDLEPYKWTGERPMAGTHLGPDTLAGTNYFEMVYHGSLNDLANDPDKGNNIAILRQNAAWPTPDGKWAKVYVTSSRKVFVIESTDNFVSWEAEHLISSSP